MSAEQIDIATEIAAPPTLEVIWQQDASAYVFKRSRDGELSAEGLQLGKPARAELAFVGDGVEARRVEVVELIRVAGAPPAGLDLGDSARAAFAIVELAQRSVAE